MVDVTQRTAGRTAARRASARGDTGLRGTGRLQDTSAGGVTAAGFLLVFIFSMLFPVYFHLGDLRLSPLRILMLAAFIPLAVRLFSGAAGRLNGFDVVFGLFCVWMSLSLLITDGPGRIPLIGITVVELYGGYLVGRVLVRSYDDYMIFIRYFLIGLAFLFPFALLELLTSRQLLNDFFGSFASTFHKGVSTRPRWGLMRTMASFEHAILFGLFCSIGFANVFYLYREQLLKRIGLTGFVTFMTFMSLSSGPLLSVVLQSGMIAWNKITKGRWGLLIVLTIIAYVTVDLLSNRTPITILISYVTFDAHTAWTRVAQWDHGTANVLANPVFGLGVSATWDRPSWLTGSVDNFWLVIAMRHGLPGIALLLGAIGVGIWRIVRARGLSAEAETCRTGYMITLVGVLITLATVHIWGAVSVFVMFYLGAGQWLAEAGDSPESSHAPSSRTPLRARPQRSRAALAEGGRTALERAETGRTRPPRRPAK
jgi:hypothetical protein